MQPAGLINVGNSCYLGSVLQLLAATGNVLIEHFADAGKVGMELSVLLREINESGRRTVNPERFIRSFAVDGLSHEQQDAHEFLLILLNLQRRRVAMICGGLKDFEGTDRAPVGFKMFQETDLFTGIVLNEIICLPCASKRKKRHISSLRIEPFSCLTLIIENNTVNEAVYRQLCVPERIGDYVNYDGSGNRCGPGAVNQKTPLLLPKLLFLQVALLTSTLTPFKSSDSLQTQIELSGPGYRYKLLAVVVHFGSTGNSGHFICYRRNKTKWFECNDSRVTNIKEEEILKQRPYLLLYESI